MTNSATHGGTYYVLRSRVIPGLYKPGIAHNFERRLQQHGGPDKWETVATFYLGPLIARGFELRMLRRFGHRRIGPHPEERMHLADQELAQLLALAEEEQARADAARATVAAGNSTPTTPHAQRQLDHAARWAERGQDYRPAPGRWNQPAKDKAEPVEPEPAASTPAPRTRQSGWWPWALGAAALLPVAGPAGTLPLGLYAGAASLIVLGPFGPVFALIVAWKGIKAAIRTVRP